MRYKIDYNDVFIFLLVVFSLNFYTASFAQFGIIKNLSYGYLLFAILISCWFFFIKGNSLAVPIQFVVVSIAFSTLTAHFFWDQDLIYSVSVIPYLLWIFFFYLLHINYPIERIENVVLVYGIFYILLFLFQFFNSDVVYFGFNQEFLEDRGTVRINFPGAGVFFLSFFIALNKITGRDRMKWFFILFVLIGITVTFLQVFRQSIVFIILVTAFHFIKDASSIKKIGIALFFFLLSFILPTFHSSIIDGLLEAQKETVSDGSDYIRILAADYFLSNFSPNWLSSLFGNGFPNYKSEYGELFKYLEDYYGFYASDVGLVGFYVFFGIVPVIALLFILGRCILFRVPKEYYYLKYYVVFIALTSLTSDNIYSINYMVTNVFVIYSFQKLINQRNNIKTFIHPSS